MTGLRLSLLIVSLAACGEGTLPDDEPVLCEGTGVGSENNCQLDQQCVDGACARCTEEHFAICNNGVCVDLWESEVHCGICGYACDPGQACLRGLCE